VALAVVVALTSVVVLAAVLAAPLVV